MRVKYFVLLGAIVAGLAGYAAFRHGDLKLPVLTSAEKLAPVSFYDKSGAKVTLEQFKGRPALVNLWATWCLPCVHELPALDRLQQKMPELAVVAISVDKSSAAELEAFLVSKGVKTLAVYKDTDREIQTKWKYDGLPTSYLIDKNGNIIRRYDGPFAWDQDAMVKEIQAAID